MLPHTIKITLTDLEIVSISTRAAIERMAGIENGVFTKLIRRIKKKAAQQEGFPRHPDANE